MALTATATRNLTLCNSFYSHRNLLKPTKFKLLGFSDALQKPPNLSFNHRVGGSFFVHATNSPGGDDNGFLGLPQEDVSYLWKLGASSFLGAAAIKYGSIVFPEITRPNILQALIMISAPVIVAILLLIKQSSSE